MEKAEDAAGFDPEELDTWSALATLLEWLPQALNAQLHHDSGMTHFEFGILFALEQAEGGTLRMSQLAGYANSTLSRLSRATSRLERKDWIRRAADPQDGRATVAMLTPQGHDAVQAAGPGHVALVRKLVFSSLSATQAEQLGHIARRIAAAIQADGGWRPSG